MLMAFCIECSVWLEPNTLYIGMGSGMGSGTKSGSGSGPLGGITSGSDPGSGSGSGLGPGSGPGTGGVIDAFPGCGILFYLLILSMITLTSVLAEN